MKTTLPAVITKVLTMRDKSVRIQLDTQELTPEQMSEVFGLYGNYGYFFFNESEGLPELTELPPLTVEKGQKTPSERLRAILFVYWTQQGQKGSFNEFYWNKMDEWIEYIKSKLI